MRNAKEALKSLTCPKYEGGGKGIKRLSELELY